MNIFVLDTNPRLAARYHCNKHVIKMCLETAQILCSVRHINKDLLGYTDDNIPYRLTHKNHPAVLWAAQANTNYLWLLLLGQHLCEEYTYRYGKVHKSQKVIGECKAAYASTMKFPNDNVFLLDNANLYRCVTPFVQCMPDCYKNDNVVTAYRNYYMGEKARFAEWKNSEVPWWFCRNIKK